MSFDINTNIASLQAQQYLRVNSDFQAKTINRVTSGLRIISSGDDAAGLAIANGYRSDQAVLTQGIRNANDGLSTLADHRWRHEQHFAVARSRPHPGHAVGLGHVQRRPRPAELRVHQRAGGNRPAGAVHRSEHRAARSPRSFRCSSAAAAAAAPPIPTLRM